MVVKILIGLVIGIAIGGLMGSTRSCDSGGCPLTANPWRGALFGGILGCLFALSFATEPNKPAVRDTDSAHLEAPALKPSDAPHDPEADKNNLPDRSEE